MKKADKINKAVSRMIKDFGCTFLALKDDDEDIIKECEATGHKKHKQTCVECRASLDISAFSHLPESKMCDRCWEHYFVEREFDVEMSPREERSNIGPEMSYLLSGEYSVYNNEERSVLMTCYRCSDNWRRFWPVRSGAFFWAACWKCR